VTLICILKGAFIFLADLVRNILIPLKVEFVGLSSYGSNSQSLGEIRVTKDIQFVIKGKDVILVEDIIDTGLTIAYLRDRIAAENPNSLRICVLIDKEERREVDIKADYAGFRLEEGFVVGYGLDFDERYRQLPDIWRIVDKLETRPK